jgi:hypothetical protein
MTPVQTRVQYPKNWSSEAIRKYFTRESTQKDRDEFYATHVPINRIKVEQDDVFFNITDDDYVTERDVRGVVTDASLDEDNRLFFLVGESGCGKSELCQWLDYEIDAGNYEHAEENSFEHVPIHIPRQVREPQEVLQRLADHLGEEVQGSRKLSELHPDAVFQQTIGTIKNQFTRKFDATHSLLTDKAFESTVRDNLSRFVESFDDPDIEIEFEPIAEDELEDLVDSYPGVVQEHGGEHADVVDVLYKSIESRGREAIQTMLGLGNLKSTLSDLSKRFQERDERPVLIIEDLTAFTIYEHELLAFFSDLQTGNWDVIIGMTTGIHDGLTAGRRADRFAEDTINDRIQARLVMTEQTEDGSHTLFLEQEDVHIDLAKQYLTAIKEESDQPFNPPLPVGAEEVEEAFDGLYPFNEAFLTRIYDNLEEEENKKQTPRVFLKFVLEDLLDNEEPPFTQVEYLKKLGTIEDLISTEYDEDDRSVLKWYGRPARKKQRVDPTIPEVFGVKSNGEARLAGAPRGQDPQEPDRPGQEPDPDAEQWEEYKQRRNELLAWRRGETTFDQTQAIERGAQRAVLFFHDDINELVREECLAQDAGYLAWEKGSDKVPIHVDNGDEPKYRKVVLDRDLPESVLLDLLYLGIHDDGDETILRHASSNPPGRRGQAVYLPALQEWAGQTSTVYQQGLEEDIVEQFGASIDEIALFGKYILNIFTGNNTTFSPSALAKPIDDPSLSPSYKPLDLEIDLNKLEENAETLIRLFKARFHLRTNTVDYERLETVVEQIAPTELVYNVRKITHGPSGASGFKTGATKSGTTTDLREFLTSPSSLNLRGCARDLNDYQPSYTEDLESTREELAGIATLYTDLSEPEDLDLETLHFAYEQTSARPLHLDDIAEIPVEHFEAVTTELRGAAEALDGCGSLWQFLGAYRRFARFRYQQYSEEYKTLVNVAEELDRLEEELDGVIAQGQEQEIEPDTSDFADVQETALDVADNMEDTL